MTIDTKYEVGNLVILNSSHQLWRIISIHASVFANTVSVVYDLQNDFGHTRVVKEFGIKGSI